MLNNSSILTTTQNILFIDSKVQYLDQLIAGVNPNTSVYVLHPQENGLAQITSILQLHPQIKTVYLMAHGEPGRLYLGNDVVTENSLIEAGKSLKTWNIEQIFIYACNVAQGNQGEAFLQSLHLLTGAKIAASSQLIGKTASGQNWDLDKSTEPVEIQPILNEVVMANYAGVLVTFSKPTKYSTGGSRADKSTVGDVNNDHIPDVVTGNRDSDNISIFLGKGDGTFKAPTLMTAGDGAHYTVIKDLNKDGLNDITVGNNNGDSISIFLANSNGGFNNPKTFTGIAAPHEIKVADFNNDKNLDVIGTTQHRGDSIVVLLGDGKGNFTQATTNATNPLYIAVADFNRDSILDVVTTQWDGYNLASYLSVYLGKDDGTFNSPTQINLGTTVTDVESADFNGDGLIDLVTANINSDTVSVLLGKGNGSFGNPTQFKVGDTPHSPIVADFNGDGFTDIVTNNQNSNNISVLLGKGNGQFAPSVEFTTGDYPGLSGDAADINGDKYPDIVMPTGNDIAVLLNTSVVGTLGINDSDFIREDNTNNYIDGLGGNDVLIGNGGNDKIIGGVGNDWLIGDAGKDTLTGGLGADRFIYSTNTTFTTKSLGLDTITDFVIAQGDKIVLDKTTFPKISSIAGTGFSQKSEFAKVTTNTAAAASAADIVYNSATGGLFYNENGTAAGYGTGSQFLTLTNKPALTATQFIIQA